MRRYSEALRADLRRRMSPPHRQSVAQMSAELGHALPVGRVHPSPHISLNSLAVTTHWSCPQAPGWMDQRGDIFPETGGVP